MIAWLKMALLVAFAGLRSRRNLVLENLALRHQLLVCNRRAKRPRLTPVDRALWAWLSHSWADWKTALLSPTKHYVERLIGSVRRECLDHVIVFSQAHLHRLLTAYFSYYHGSRTHLALSKDAPEPRPVFGPDQGKIVACPEVGGLHHRYERLAA